MDLFEVPPRFCFTVEPVNKKYERNIEMRSRVSVYIYPSAISLSHSDYGSSAPSLLSLSLTFNRFLALRWSGLKIENTIDSW